MSDVRLIDANKLQRWLKTTMANANPLHCDIKETYSECITMVNVMETIDAVPVVRCKECIHRGTDNCPMIQEDYYYDEDDGSDYVMRDHTEDNGFCHKGARMDGGADG